MREGRHPVSDFFDPAWPYRGREHRRILNDNDLERVPMGDLECVGCGRSGRATAYLAGVPTRHKLASSKAPTHPPRAPWCAVCKNDGHIQEAP